MAELEQDEEEKIDSEEEVESLVSKWVDMPTHLFNTSVFAKDLDHISGVQYKHVCCMMSCLSVCLFVCKSSVVLFAFHSIYYKEHCAQYCR